MFARAPTVPPGGRGSAGLTLEFECVDIEAGSYLTDAIKGNNYMASRTMVISERIETDDHCCFDLAATIVACGNVSSSSRCSDIIVMGISGTTDRIVCHCG
jgi:hypothetical protein